MRKVLFAFVALLFGPAVVAQQSASFEVESAVFNAGGNPAGGVALASSSFRVSLDALGDAVVADDLASVSFRSDATFVGRYPPPGEVPGLGFLDAQTLSWSPERSAGGYNLYRGLLGQLTALQFGSCVEQDLSATSTTDTDPVPADDGYVYLVTVRNRLREEGTKGFQSNGTERLGEVCP